MVDLTRGEEEEDAALTNRSKRKTSLTKSKTNLKKQRATTPANSNAKNSNGRLQRPYSTTQTNQL
jgi:hypothetical protein